LMQAAHPRANLLLEVTTAEPELRAAFASQEAGPLQLEPALYYVTP
jgi:hypothetical protein